MAKKVINRFGRIILLGDVATINLPRGGHAVGRVTRIAREEGAYRLTLDGAMTASIDDVVNIIDSARIQTVADHFIIAAIWADQPEEIEGHVTATKETRRVAYELCAKFIASNLPLFLLAMKADGYGSHPDAGSPEAAFGHDLWLTLQGHGTGFWDRSELKVRELGDKLSDVCINHKRPSYDFAGRYFYLYE